MNGFQRFIFLILCILAVMVCFPYYPTGAVWGFVGMVLAIGTAVIVVIALPLGFFGFDRFEWVNRFVTVLLAAGILYSLLTYMPQEDGRAPIVKLQEGEIPSMETVKIGLKRLTFNFDFVRRNVNSEQNFVNQNNKKTTAEKAKKPVKKEQSEAVSDPDMEIVIEMGGEE